ncbi:MAG: hypothetical protein WCG47_13525 [Dermatophilaceae bacterium]
MTKPVIGTAPCSEAGCMGAVGVPVWLWTQPWVAQSATASAGGISVTVTAKVGGVTWSMGDGKRVVCGTPGTPFDVSMGVVPSPDCGYRYERTSAKQPGQKYAVTATASWIVVWSGAYTANTTVTTSTATSLAIGEYQVLTQ